MRPCLSITNMYAKTDIRHSLAYNSSSIVITDAPIYCLLLFMGVISILLDTMLETFTLTLCGITLKSILE